MNVELRQEPELVQRHQRASNQTMQWFWSLKVTADERLWDLIQEIQVLKYFWSNKLFPYYPCLKKVIKTRLAFSRFLSTGNWTRTRTQLTVWIYKYNRRLHPFWVLGRALPLIYGVRLNAFFKWRALRCYASSKRHMVYSEGLFHSRKTLGTLPLPTEGWPLLETFFFLNWCFVPEVSNLSTSKW